MALEALGYGCEDGGLVFSIGAHLLSCVIPVWKHGSEEQKRRYLPGLCDGTRIAANGMSEPDSGSDAFAMRTKAVSIDGGFRINGTKTFISNGPVADVALTFAVTDSAKGYYGGITAFLVDSDTPGFRVGKPIEKMGLRTSLMSELVYDDVFVPESAVLGGVGGGASIFTHSMDWERVGIFASHVGTMERLLERSIQHARTRQQFGRPIGSYQAIAHRLADMKVQLEAARLLVYKAAWSLEHSRGAAMDASITKLFVSESLVKAALDAMQVFGGYGYMTEYGLERLLRDAVGSTVYSGTSEMQRTIIARWLGLQRSVE
jgi:alkylation response protein AidB-like acyl-CoA dehydrogenase